MYATLDLPVNRAHVKLFLRRLLLRRNFLLLPTKGESVGDGLVESDGVEALRRCEVKEGEERVGGGIERVGLWGGEA
jgi:hypothetical protein